MADSYMYWEDNRRKEVVTPVPAEILAFIKILNSSTQNTSLYQAEFDLTRAYNWQILDEGGEKVDFDKPENALCYICHYSLTHILGCFKALSIIALEQDKYLEWFVRRANDPLSICAIGGGPGTDAAILQAHMQWLSSNSQSPFKSKLPAIADVCILDRRTKWIESYNTFFKPSLQLPDANFLHFDFTADEMFREEHLNELQRADIVSVIKFVSAVMKKKSTGNQDHRIVQLLETVAESMKSDSLLLYADTGFDSFGILVNGVLATRPKFYLLFREVFEFSNFEYMAFNGATVPKRYILEVQLWHKLP